MSLQSVFDHTKNIKQASLLFKSSKKNQPTIPLDLSITQQDLNFYMPNLYKTNQWSLRAFKYQPARSFV